MEGSNPTAASDWFAFGMTILEAASGRVPWANVLDDVIVIDNVKRGKLPACPPGASHEVWQLIEEVCKLEPAKRLTGNDLLAQLKVLVNQSDVTEKCCDISERIAQSSLEPSMTSPTHVSKASSGDRQDPRLDHMRKVVAGLQSSDGATRVEALAALECLAEDHDNHATITHADGITALVNIIAIGSDLEKQHATAALSCLSKNAAIRDAIIGAGAIQHLVAFATGIVNALVSPAMGVLAQLAEVDGAKAQIISAGGLSATLWRRIASRVSE